MSSCSFEIGQGAVMQNFDLTQDFTDVSAEQQVLASFSRNPQLYQIFRELISAEMFFHHRDDWASFSAAIKTGQELPAFSLWDPSPNLEAAVLNLTELSAKRTVAEAIQNIGKNLYESGSSATQVLAQANLILSRAAKKSTRTAPIHATEILVEVISDAERRSRERETGGGPVLGQRTGIDKLDAIMGGFSRGLYIFAGPPGVGKTTLALQFSIKAAGTLPVIFVTFENPARNLTVKAICAQAGIDTQDVSRGTANLNRLRSTALQWGQNVAPRLDFVEGTSELSVTDVREIAIAALNRHNAAKCFIVVDYLQLWAKASATYARLDSPRTRVELLSTELRELAMRLDSPLLAIAAQNRQHGDYGDGSGNASLDSLKESGDIEYLCDVAMFLVSSKGHAPTPNTRYLQLVIKKNRDGQTGQVPLSFRPDYSQFREAD
jgi:replicative DNA helicase